MMMESVNQNLILIDEKTLNKNSLKLQFTTVLVFEAENKHLKLNFVS